MMTDKELKERLATEFDELTLLDMLEVTSEEIVAAFNDRILEKREELLAEIMAGDDETF